MSEDPEMCADVGKDNDGCLCVLFVGNPELEGAINMDCPVHCPPLGPDDCECGNMHGVHKREVPGCEYHNHHCDLCHDNKLCTTTECKWRLKLLPITHVALRFEGKIYSLPKPNRHGDIIRMLVDTGVTTCVRASGDNQGFLDASGQYLTRKEALVNALENKQVKDENDIRASRLFSEDVW